MCMQKSTINDINITYTYKLICFIYLIGTTCGTLSRSLATQNAHGICILVVYMYVHVIILWDGCVL